MCFGWHWVVRENIHTLPTEEIAISWGLGVLKSKNLKKCMKLTFNWNFQRGGEVLEKIPSVGKVWIYSGTTHSSAQHKTILIAKYYIYMCKLKKVNLSLRVYKAKIRAGYQVEKKIATRQNKLTKHYGKWERLLPHVSSDMI